MDSLVFLYEQHGSIISSQDRAFLENLENSLAEDLWKSLGGHWSQEATLHFRSQAMHKLHQEKLNNPQKHLADLWPPVVRDFHGQANKTSAWGQNSLQKKEKLPLTKEQKITREMLLYVLVLLQVTFITKTLILYIGFKFRVGDEDGSNLTLWLILAFIFTLLTTTYFAFRKHQKDPTNHE